MTAIQHNHRPTSAVPDPAPPLSIFNQGPNPKKTEIIYRSQQMHQVVNNALLYAGGSATVLITGENGTGKELFAKLIHESSQRPADRYARVNCAALSESLIESELFGHEKGAFTGADAVRIGRFEWANHGTLLLDEISEVDLRFQAKLLRALEENEIQRVGGNETIKSDVRIVATSNRDLLDQVRQGKFREDLYYRLNVLRLELPALRERQQDIPLLANLFLNKFAGESRTLVRGFSKRAIAKLCGYSWPGNVRQLRNTIHRACVIARTDIIEERDLDGMNLNANVPRDMPIPRWMLDATLEEIEKRLILLKLNSPNASKTSVANSLGITTRTLANKINKYREQGDLVN